MVNELDVARTAGILEGEGSFFCLNNKIAKVSCQMTDSDVISFLHETWGGKVYYYPSRKPKWKDTWVWNVLREDAVAVMEAIRPFMFKRRSETIADVLNKWYLFQAQKQSKADVRSQAALAYLTSNKSLRTIAKEFSMSYESVRRAVKMVS